jgi:small ligand-binding sensory domain FIST
MGFVMSAVCSSQFISAGAAGETWRDISRRVLEQINESMTEGFRPQFGLVYLTEALAEDAGSILTLLRSVTGVEHWSGCAAIGVLVNDIEYVDVPAMSVLIGAIPPHQFIPYQTDGSDFKVLRQSLEPWLNAQDPMLVLAHAHPLDGANPAHALEEIESLVGGFMIGGLASARGGSMILGQPPLDKGVSGLIFSSDVAVATAVSQGCVPMGELHTISSADDHVIAYLDGKRPVDIFTQELKKMAQLKLGRDPDEILLDKSALTDEGIETLPPELRAVLRGEAHIAFPVSGTDQQDFLVRNILAIDPESGMMAVSDFIEEGQRMMFVHRDHETVKADLSRMLVSLRQRVIAQTGGFKPKAAVYISCVARAGVPFGDNDKAGGEMALVRDVLGEIPLTGFYASGEISNNRIYGYTGVLTLFL